MGQSPWRRAALIAWVFFAIIGCVLGLVAVALDQGALQGALVRVLAWRMGRSLAVRGPLRLHLLSAHPSLEADEVTLGNPPWTRPGTFGTARHVVLAFRWGRGLDTLQLYGADLRLLRDTEGFANWQFRRPVPGRVPVLPPLEVLRAVDVHLNLKDAQRHLEFDGAVSGGSAEGSPLKLTAQGTLNSHPAQLSLAGDPLHAGPADAPYRLVLSAAGSGAQVSLKGTLPKPFELDLLDASFEADGADLKDLFFLTGLRLADTGGFRLAGRLERRGTLTRITSLSLSAGASDLEGTLSIESAGQRPRVEGELHSRVLRSPDIGLRAAGRDPDPDPPLFADVPWGLAGMRHEDVEIRYGADRLQLGRLEITQVSGQLRLARGVLAVPDLEGRLLGGRLSGQLQIDARRDLPLTEIGVQLQGADLQALPLNMTPNPLGGPLQFSAHLKGRGPSLHEVAATLDGTAEFQVSQGVIRASMAELTGLDLRGVGLTLSHDRREIGLRCAVGRFDAAAGILTASRLIIDTDTVVIRGEGRVYLGDESLDLSLRGEPKQTRLLRLATPLLIEGSLRHPKLMLHTRGAALRLIDPGHLQDIDCSAR